MGPKGQQIPFKMFERKKTLLSKTSPVNFPAQERRRICRPIQNADLVIDSVARCCIIGSTNPCRITRKVEQTKYVLCTLKNLF